MSPVVEPSHHHLAGVVKFLLSLAVAFLLLLGYVFHQSYEGRKDTVAAQRLACERGKLDRQANADGWTAHARYINSVTTAASVKEDVKRAARRAQATYRLVSRDLGKRAKIDCAAAFPNPSFF